MRKRRKEMSEKCVCHAQSTFSPKCTFISCGIFRSKIEPALQKACEIKYFNTQNLCTYFENMIVLNKCRETRQSPPHQKEHSFRERWENRAHLVSCEGIKWCWWWASLTCQQHQNVYHTGYNWCVYHSHWACVNARLLIGLISFRLHCLFSSCWCWPFSRLFVVCFFRPSLYSHFTNFMRMELCLLCVWEAI